MKKTKNIFFLLVGITLFSSISAGEAVTVFVATDGTGDYNCDGVDDHVEINLALKEVGTAVDGGTVHLKSGTYTIGDTLVVYSNTILEGDDWTSVIKLKNWAGWPQGKALIENKNMRLNVEDSNITLQNFKLDGNRDNQSESGGIQYVFGIYLGKTRDITVSNVYIYKVLHDSITLGIPAYGAGGTSRNVLIKDVRSEYPGHSGVFVGGDGTDNIIVENSVFVIKANSGVRTYNANNVIIRNNLIYGTKLEPSYFVGDWGIQIEQTNNNYVNSVLVENNTIYDTAASGIAIWGINPDSPTHASGVIIKNNLIYHTSFGNREASLESLGGIQIGNFYNTVIESNVIFNNKGSGIVTLPFTGDGASRYPDWPENLIVRNNIIVNNTKYAIDTSDISQANITASYNDIWGNTLGNYVGSGNISSSNTLSLNPLFANPTIVTSWSGPSGFSTDLHLKSQGGRWTTAGWVTTDSETSPCIGAGDPSSDNSQSLWGGVIEMGAYGNTAEASKSSGPQNIVYVATDGSGNYNCDGTDDHLEINQAMEYINSIGGGTVHLRPGMYTIDDTILVYSNTTMEGDGWNSIIKLADSAGWNTAEKPLIGNKHWNTGPQDYNIILRNFKVDGNRDKQSEPSGYMYYINVEFIGVTNVVIENLHLTRNLNDSIKFGKWGWGQPVQNAVVRNVLADYNGHAGVYDSGGNNITVENSVFMIHSNSGVRGYNTNNYYIRNNIIFGGPEVGYATGDMGIQIEQSGSTFVNNVIIENNTIYDTPSSGIAIWGISPRSASHATGVVIKNNRLFHNSWTAAVTGREASLEALGGIQIGNFYNTIIENNTIFDNKGSGIVTLPYQGDGASRYPQWTENFIVRNNVIVNNTKYAIDTSDISNASVLINYNDLWGNTLGDYSGSGTVLVNNNISTDPLFADALLVTDWSGPSGLSADLHLKSQYGRYTPAGLVTDSVTSLAIAAGDPTSDNSRSPWDGRIEMGAYGNTAEASKSGSAPQLDTVPPEIAVISPASGTTLATVTITVNGTAADNVNLSKIEVKVNKDGWQTATGTTSWTKIVMFTSGTNTIYARATDTSGNTKEISVTVTCYSAEEQKLLDQKITVYPNPYIKGKSSGEKINFTNLPQEATIRIYTMSGELVETIEHNDGDKENWNISGIVSGMYLYSINSLQENKQGKVSIVK